METVKNRKENEEKRYGVDAVEKIPNITVTIEVDNKGVEGSIPNDMKQVGELESVIIIGLPKRATADRSSDADEDCMGVTMCVGAIDKVNGKMFIEALNKAAEKVTSELTGLPPELLGILAKVLGGGGSPFDGGSPFGL